MKKTILLLLTICLLMYCKKEISLNFVENSIIYDKGAIIEINFPKAEGDKTVSSSINSTVENLIVNAIIFSEDSITNVSLDDAIKKFDSIYKEFKTDFEESLLVWEVIIDGEVTYQSPSITCIAINSYLNTGGAHGNMSISFLNFNSQTGEVFQNNDLIKNSDAFNEIAKSYFNIEMQESSNEDKFEDYFFGEDFHLPANIGFSDEGVILLYNVYEIASYAQGITEFTIPFEEALPYLKIN